MSIFSKTNFKKFLTGSFISLVSTLCMAQQQFPVPKYIAYNNSYSTASGAQLLLVSSALNDSRQAACASFPSIINAGLASIADGTHTVTYSSGTVNSSFNYLCNAMISVDGDPSTPVTMAHINEHYYCIGIDPLPTPLQHYYQITSIRTEGVPCPTPCPVPPLAPITDPDALDFENGRNTVREDRLTAATVTKLQCLRTAVTNAFGTLTVTSAWRPQTYQNHLREIVDKYALLISEENLNNPLCTPIRTAVLSEKQRHGLGTVVGVTSRHTEGTAFDATWANITNAQIDQFAATCNLNRPFPRDDPVHFQ